MQAIEPAPHEFSANLIFNEHGLKPFFAADSKIKEGDGSYTGYFDRDGREWQVVLSFQESGLIPPDSGKLPSGQEFSLQTIREFRIKAFPLNDAVGQIKFNAHIAPRWAGMRAKTNEGKIKEIDLPPGLKEAVNIQVRGSNIEFSQYHDILQAAFSSLGISRRYFETPHEFSNILDAERYVRLHHRDSGPLHGRDGPIASMGHLLENDRDGYRKVVQNDQNERSERLPGYYHTVTLGSKRVQYVFPDHKLPKEIKHYYAKEALSFPDDHPLRHPKLGVSFQRSRWDGTLKFEYIEELQRELDETLLSLLAEAGLSLYPTENEGRPYFADQYFQIDSIEIEQSMIYELDLIQLRHDQQSVVIRYLADGMSPVQWESLQTLLADGGEVSPDEIADYNGRHPDSVRRALRDMEELVHREYGHVSLKSPFIAELLHKKVKAAKEATRDAASASAKIAEAAERGLDETTSAFIAWAASVGADVNDRQEARLLMRLPYSHKNPKAKYVLKKGFQLWTEAGKDPIRFKQAKITFGNGVIALGHNLLR